MNNKNNKNYIFFLLNYAFKKELITYYGIMIFIFIIVSVIYMKRPIYQAEIIDMLSKSESIKKNIILEKLLFFLALLLSSYILNYVKEYLARIVSERISCDLIMDLNRKINNVDNTYFLKNSFNDIQVKIDKDIEIVKNFGITSLINLVSNILVLIIVIPFMFTIDRAITTINVILILLIPIFSKIIGKDIEKRSKTIIALYSKLLLIIEDNFMNWKNTRLFFKYNYVISRFNPIVIQYKREIIKRYKMYIINKTVAILLQFIGTVFIWIIGIKNIFEGNMTIGIIIAFMNYQNLITNPILEITNFYNEFHTAKESLNNIYNFFEYPDEKRNKAIDIKGISSIQVADLEFSYNDNRILNIKKIGFEKGKIYAIKGCSGKGKSTFADILSGNINYYRGKIVVDGINLEDINITSYRDQIAYVMQSPVFYNDYFVINLNNIDGVEEYDFEVDKEIYLKKIDSKNKNLSGGQYKMLDFIRNMSKKCSVLILDEPTSGVDAVNKRKIINKIKSISADKIVLLITHDDTEAELADYVLELVDGDFL